MEKKSSAGKYVLIFEPEYVFHQYAIYFTPSGDAKITKIKKYSDKAYDNERRTIKKNTLADIDKVTASFTDLDSFFKTYVSPEIFKYNGFNLHKMFVGYMRNNRMHTIDYSINNPKLLNKLPSVDGNKMVDSVLINSMVNFILTSENNRFLGFVTQEKKERRTGLSSDTIEIAKLLRNSVNNMDGVSEIDELQRNLKNKLTSYKEYREMYLLKQRYQIRLKEEKEKMVELKQEIKTIPQLKKDRKNLFRFDVEPESASQISFYDPVYKVKSIGKKED